MRVIQSLILSAVAFSASSHCMAERLTPEKLWDLGRIGDAAVSPDGKQLAFLVTRYDLEKNEGTTSLMLQPLPAGEIRTAGRKSVAFDTPLAAPTPRALLKDIKGLGSLGWLNHSTAPKLVYIAPAKDDDNDDAKKQEDGKEEEQEKSKPQAWMIDPSGGKPRQLTHVEQGIANLKASPAGDAIAFTVDVKMDDKVAEIYPDLPKADARIIDSLLYRHWNAWHDYAYSHVHVARIDPSEKVSEPIDVMASMKADCPMPPFGGAEQFALSPDGKQIALHAEIGQRSGASTDSDSIWLAIDGGTGFEHHPGMPGYDKNPVYSPDGKLPGLSLDGARRI